MVRVPSSEPTTIRRCLEVGIQGVIVPHVKTKEEVLRAVEAAKLPPRGRRGADPRVRAGGYGTTPWDEYVKDCNQDSIICPTIEDKEATDNLEEILSVREIDIVWFGPVDFAVSMGVQFDDPIIGQTEEKLVESFLRKGIAPQVIYRSAEHAKKMFDSRNNKTE